MKTLKTVGIIALLLNQALPAFAKDQNIEMGTSFTTTGSLEQAQSPQLVGRVMLTHVGQIHVIWDGVSLNLGGASVGLNDSKVLALQSQFPTLTLDLQELLGVNWMKSIKLQVSGGFYDNDPIRNTTDIQIGKIALSLTQSVIETDSWSWSVTESASVGGLFKREFHESGAVFEAIPVTLALNSTVVKTFSKDLAMSLSIGAYTTVLNSLNQGQPLVVAGGSFSADLNFRNRLSGGVRLDASELFIPGADGNGKVTVNATAYLKYVLNKNPEGAEHAISLNLGTLYDEALSQANGNPRKNWTTTLQYTVRF